MKQQFHLVNDAIKQNAINFIRELPVDAVHPLILDIKEMTRTRTKQENVAAPERPVRSGCLVR